MVAQFPIALAAIASMSIANIGASKPAQNADSFTVPLTAEAQVSFVETAGGTGDSDGSGVVRLTLDPVGRQICFDFDLSGLSTPLMAHIHRGAAHHNGPSVVTLFTGPGVDLHDCVMWTEKRLAEIVADPSSFYVSLSTTEFPDGALRGQLSS